MNTHSPRFLFSGILIFLLTFSLSFSQTWTPIGQTINGLHPDGFAGNAVDISGSGDIIALGEQDNDSNETNAGAVQLLEWTGTDWIPFGPELYGDTLIDYFGSDVSLNFWGSVVAIGSKLSQKYGVNAGKVQVFEMVFGQWQQRGADIIPTGPNGELGTSVSLSKDGDRLAVGAPFGGPVTAYEGLARVYDWTGSNWVQVGSDFIGVHGDQVGTSLALSNDGNTVVLGMPTADNEIGKVSVWKYDGYDWTQFGSTQYGQLAGDRFGNEVAINGNGDIILVGIPGYDGDRGRVQSFQWDGYDWLQIGQDIDGMDLGDYWGAAVDLNDDGSRLVAGAMYYSDPNAHSGQARVFEMAGSTWVQLGPILGGDSTDISEGTSVAITADGDRVIAGGGGPVGHARVFQECQPDYTLVEMVGCDSLDLPDGTVYFQNDTVIITTLDQQGCPSIVEYWLFVEPTPIIEDLVQSCGPYTWLDGQTYTTSNNTAQFTLIGQDECDTIMQLNLTITEFNTSVITNGPTLESEESDASYWWFECTDGPDSTSFFGNDMIFSPIANGNYGVVLEKDGCKDTSDCVSFNIIGLPGLNSLTEIYFDTSSDQLKLNKLDVHTDFLQITNLQGILVYDKSIPSSGAYTLDMSELPAGMYSVSFLKSGQYYKFIKR